MKNISKKKSIDVLAEFRKSPRYPDLMRDAEWKIRFAVEVYNARTEQGLSQQVLAKKIGSTQKVVSNIENADVDMRVSMINRLAHALGFNALHWSRIYKFELSPKKINAVSVNSNKIKTTVAETVFSKKI